MVYRSILLILLFPFLVSAQTGRVVGVSDGDTFTLLTSDNQQIKVRLNGIDCPEKKQPFGQRAKEYTSDLVFGKIVTLSATKLDRYGRTLATVFVNDTVNVNAAILRAGYAWHYKKYSKDLVLSKIEADARQKRIGLWQDPNPVEPDAYRRARRTKTPAPPASAE